MITLILFFLLLLFGVPIAIVLGLTTVIYVLTTGNFGMFDSLPQRLFNGIQNFSLLAIPMFVLVGELMNTGGITTRLIRFSSVVFGSVRGGLAYVNVAANMFLASIMGSATAQTAVMSRTIVPEMEKQGYSRDFASALTAASSIVGPLIPPSMPFIIYGVLAGVSISKLFVAGIVPGILFGVCFALMIYVISIKQNFPRSERPTWSKVWKDTFNVLPALAIPTIIMVGILLGIFTATESAAIAALLAFLVGAFFYRELKFKDLPKILSNTVITSATVAFLITVSNLFGWVLTYEKIPQLIAKSILAFADTQWAFLLLVNLILFVVGMFLDGVAALILLVPILYPIAMNYGVDPIHFGVLITINLTIGLMTPPVGTVLFVTSALAEIKIERLVKALLPFLVMAFVVLFLITYVPQLTTSIFQWIKM